MSKAMEILRTKLNALSAPALRARFEEATGQKPKSPNRKYQIRVIMEHATKAKGTAKTKPDAGAAGKTKGKGKAASTAADAPSAPTARARNPLRDLSVKELQAEYVKEVGRPTKSDNRAYLLWKIDQAQKGRVKVGPRVKVDPGEKQVLPLTLSKDTVKVLDAACKAQGYKSRTAFLREAIGEKLKKLGELDAAARFLSPSKE